jgi:hypothetical protein
MKKHLPTWLRTLASTVATVYFFSNVVLAYTPEKNLWAERRRHIEKSSANQTEQQDNLLLASLPAASSPVAMFQSLPSASRVTSALSEELAKTLPLSVTAAHAKLFSSLQTTHGTIRKVWLPAKNAGDRVVVHIQDVHQNQDAQRHIGGAIESLLSSGQAGIVGLEGAFAPIDVKAYHDYKNREVIRLTADYLLKENLITGPVHTAMTTPAPLAPMVGVDDATHYNANVDAYRLSAPNVDTYKKAWTAKKFALAQEKKKVFSPALLAFDSQVEGYHSRGEGLADYVSALSPVKGQGPAGLLAQAFEMENALDFNRVEADRKDLIDALVKTLTQDQINHLVQESTAYRVGQVRYAEFYVYLNDLCRGAKVDLAKYPHMDAYIRYVMLSDRIDGEKLLTELAALEKSRYAALVKTEEEKTLVARSRALTLAGRLITFELSPEEWADYVKNNAGESLGLDMAGFEAFYKEAHARDESLTTNLLKAMEDGHHRTAVLVTGGYHTDGVSERLTQAGVTVVTFTPRVETLDTESGSTYLSIFTQEKTPLEKLFAGEKLFLGQDPMAESTKKMMAPAVAAGASALADQSLTESRSLFALLGGQYDKIAFAVRERGTTVKVWGKEAANAVKVMVSQTPEGLSVQQTVVVGLSVASIAFFLSPFVAPLFTAISTAVVSLTGLMPGVTIGTTTIISQLMGQSGHAIVAFFGIPLPTAFDISSAVAVTTNIFAASFLILMAISFGNKLVLIQGQKSGITQFPEKSDKERRKGLTLIQNEGQAPPDEEKQDKNEEDDKFDPQPVVVGVTPYGFPIYGWPQKKYTDGRVPLGTPLQLLLALAFGISLLIMAFPQSAIAATGAANYFGFGWDQPLLWGVAISGLVVVTMLSFSVIVIHLIINAIKLDEISDYVYAQAFREMKSVEVPNSVFNTLINAPAGKEVAVISLLNTGNDVSKTNSRLFVPVVEMTEAINQVQSVTGRRNPRTARQSIQYVDDGNLVDKELEHMRGFQPNSLAGIIRFPVIKENHHRFNDYYLAQVFMIEANRALVERGILQFWVPIKLDFNENSEDQSLKRREMLKRLLMDNGFTDIEIKENKSMGTEFKAVKKGSPSIFDRFKSFIGKRSFFIIAIAASFLFASTPASPAAPYRDPSYLNRKVDSYSSGPRIDSYYRSGNIDTPAAPLTGHRREGISTTAKAKATPGQAKTNGNLVVVVKNNIQNDPLTGKYLGMATPHNSHTIAVRNYPEYRNNAAPVIVRNADNVRIKFTIYVGELSWFDRSKKPSSYNVSAQVEFKTKDGKNIVVDSLRSALKLRDDFSTKSGAINVPIPSGAYYVGTIVLGAEGNYTDNVGFKNVSVDLTRTVQPPTTFPEEDKQNPSRGLPIPEPSQPEANQINPAGMDSGDSTNVPTEEQGPSPEGAGHSTLDVNNRSDLKRITTASDVISRDWKKYVALAGLGILPTLSFAGDLTIAISGNVHFYGPLLVTLIAGLLAIYVFKTKNNEFVSPWVNRLAIGAVILSFFFLYHHITSTLHPAPRANVPQSQQIHVSQEVDLSKGHEWASFAPLNTSRANGKEDGALPNEKKKNERRNSSQRPSSQMMDPEKDAKEFIKAMSSPADLLNAVTPVARPLTLFPGTDKQTNIVEDAPRFAENMSYYGYQRGDATYLRKFKAALKEEITKKTGRQNNLQIMNILNTLLGGVTARIPFAGDTAKPTIIEATVNNQAELNAIVRTATDIQRANELMGANGPGIRLALAPSAEVTSKMIQDALFGSRVNTTNYHIKETPRNGEPFSFDEYVAASKRTMDYFNVKPTNVNLQYINAPNIGGLTAEFLSKMGSDTDDLRKLLAESLLAWLKTGDRWFTIESFNTMFEAAILAAQSA